MMVHKMTTPAVLAVMCLTPLLVSVGFAYELSDTDYVRGQTAGTLAAKGRGNDALAWGCVGGGCGGCCIGGLTPMATPLLVIPLGLGGGALGGAGTSFFAVKGDMPPADILASYGFAKKSEGYQAGFSKGYSDAIKAERTSNLITGTVVGTGAAIISWLAFIYLIYPNIEASHTVQDRAVHSLAGKGKSRSIRLGFELGY